MNDDDLIYMCGVYHKAQRDGEFLKTIKDMIQTNPCFDKNRRYLFQLIFKQIIDSIREMLRTLTSYLEVEQGMQRVEMVKVLEEQKMRNINKLIPYCNEAIDLITDELLPNAENSEAEIFFTKFQADLYRYISEFSDETDSLQALNAAEKLYNDALSLATETLPNCHPTFLSTCLNTAVFLYEHKKKCELAISLCQDAIEKYDESSADLDPETREEARETLRIMKTNLESWSCTEEEEGL